MLIWQIAFQDLSASRHTNREFAFPIRGAPLLVRPGIYIILFKTTLLHGQYSILDYTEDMIDEGIRISICAGSIAHPLLGVCQHYFYADGKRAKGHACTCMHEK